MSHRPIRLCPMCTKERPTCPGDRFCAACSDVTSLSEINPLPRDIPDDLKPRVDAVMEAIMRHWPGTDQYAQALRALAVVTAEVGVVDPPEQFYFVL